MKTYLIIISLFLSTSSLLGQYYQGLNFQNMDPDNILPNTYVNDIAMDSLGFLWLATNGGLVRYDSPAKVKSYQKGDVGLETDLIRTLEVGSNGSLWIGTTLGGLVRYDYVNEIQHTYKSNDSLSNSLSSSEILSIAEIDSTEIWVGSEGGLDVLFPYQDSIYNFNFLEIDEYDIQPGPVLDIFVDSQGWIWLTTWDGGMYVYLPDPTGYHSKGRFKQIIIPTFEGKSNVWRILEYEPKKYWLATHRSGLCYMQIPQNATNDKSANIDWEPTYKFFNSDVTNQTSIALNYIREIEIDADNNLWVGTNNGLSFLEQSEIEKLDFDIPDQEAIFSSYYQRPSKDFTINDNNITALHIGKQDLMWIGTSSGLNQHNNLTNRFKRVELPILQDATNDRNDRVNSIKPLNDNTLVLTTNMNGLVGYDLKTQTITKDLPFSNSITNQQQIQAMFLDENNYLYLGSQNGITKVSTNPPYLSKTYRINKQELSPTSSLESAPSNQQPFLIVSIFKDSQGRLWTGSENDLYLVDEQNNTWNSIISNISVTGILEDSNNDIWVTSYTGIRKIVGKGDNLEIKTFQNGDKHLKNIAKNNQIISLKQYKENIYFGYLNGFFVYNLESEKFEPFNDELNNLAINNLNVTEQGILWATTPNGLLRYHLDSNTYKLYNQKDGLQMISFRRDSNYDSDDGAVFFGCEDGLIVVDEADWENSYKEYPIYITHVNSINASSKETIETIGKSTVDIPSDNISVELHFASLNYSLPSENSYAYRLEGLEGDNWNYTSSQQVLYTNLEPKDYTFKVKRADPNGTWPDDYISIDIEVQPKFSETKTFKLLIIVLGVIGLWLIMKYYQLIANRRNNILKEYNRKLNEEIRKTEKANISLAEREVDMQLLIKKLDESNKELTRSNEDLEQYAFITSHDLQEPLRTVGAFSGLLKEKIEELDDPTLVTYADFIEKGVDRMSSLISSLLSYSLIGREGDIFQSVDLNTLLEGKIQDLSIYLENNNAEVIVDDLPEIFCRREQIGTVFYNLILNGLKFNNNPNPKVSVSAKELPGFWEFSVSDNGIGIPKEHQQKIFEIFKRLHRQNEYTGTGIGLAVCNKIVIGHKGTFTVDSEEGKGSTFTFTISKDLKNADSESTAVIDNEPS